MKTRNSGSAPAEPLKSIECVTTHVTAGTSLASCGSADLIVAFILLVFSCLSALKADGATSPASATTTTPATDSRQLPDGTVLNYENGLLRSVIQIDGTQFDYFYRPDGNGDLAEIWVRGTQTVVRYDVFGDLLGVILLGLTESEEELSRRFSYQIVRSSGPSGLSLINGEGAHLEFTLNEKSGSLDFSRIDLLSTLADKDDGLVYLGVGREFFGDGRDGDVTLKSNTVLNRDMYYNNLTIPAGIELQPNGFRIFVRTKLDHSGIITAKGMGASGGSGGRTTRAPDMNGESGSSGGSVIKSLGGSGGYGGAAGGVLFAGRNLSGGGGSPGTLENITNLPLPTDFLNAGNFPVINGGSGGGGGGGGGQGGWPGGISDGSRHGGGGGSGGGVIIILAAHIQIANSARVIASGANGGSGEQPNAFIPGNGGGGGGGGGVVYLATEKIDDKGTESPFDINGGEGGGGSAPGSVVLPSGQSGQHGAFGNILLFISETTQAFLDLPYSDYLQLPASNFTLTVSAAPTGSGSVSGAGTFPAGSTRTVTATANPNYSFVNWTDGDSEVSTSPSFTFTLNANRTLVAHFAERIPDSPVAQAPTALTTSGFTANWSASTRATGYRLDVSTSSSFTSMVSGYDNLDVGNSTSRAVTGLSAGTTYFYRVRATNSEGASPNSGTITVSTVPLAPTAISASSVTTSGFTANWSASTGATGYRLDVSTSNSFTSMVSGYDNLDVGNSTSRTVTGLSASTTYYYRVRATNSADLSPNSNTITVTTTPPTSSFVQRGLPSGYVPGVALTVTLQANPSTSTTSYVVEDQPPANWTVSNISDSGAFDATNRKVKFGPFFESSARTLTYQATPPSGESGSKCFTGIASGDGVSGPIVGDVCIDPAQYHPADNNPADLAITANEITAYGTAWKRGDDWPIGPNPIPADYLSRAGALWKGGETYKVDASISSAPLWWVNVARSAQSAQRGSRSVSLSSVSGSKAVALMPQNVKPGVAATVNITVTPAASVASYVVEDQPPSGWVVSNISQGGSFDANTGKVKWGLFFDHDARTLTYQATPPVGLSAAATFKGLASLDGVNVPISGHRTIGDASATTVSIHSIRLTDDGALEFQVEGTVGGNYAVEFSEDLQNHRWKTLRTFTSTSSTTTIRDPNKPGAEPRFYRVRSDP